MPIIGYVISCQKRFEMRQIRYLEAEDKGSSVIITPCAKNFLEYQCFVEDFSYFVSTVEPRLMFLNLMSSSI